jgi:hypothetical protein
VGIDRSSRGFSQLTANANSGTATKGEETPAWTQPSPSLGNEFFHPVAEDGGVAVHGEDIVQDHGALAKEKG